MLNDSGTFIIEIPSEFGKAIIRNEGQVYSNGFGRVGYHKFLEVHESYAMCLQFHVTNFGVMDYRGQEYYPYPYYRRKNDNIQMNDDNFIYTFYFNRFGILNKFEVKDAINFKFQYGFTWNKMETTMYFFKFLFMFFALKHCRFRQLPYYMRLKLYFSCTKTELNRIAKVISDKIDTIRFGNEAV